MIRFQAQTDRIRCRLSVMLTATKSVTASRCTYRYLLPTFLFLFALVSFVYGPTQYRSIRIASGAVGLMGYFGQNWPPPIERVSWGISFPAAVCTYPFEQFQGAIYHNPVYGIWLDIYHVVFFSGLITWWYLVGRALDERMFAEGTAVSIQTLKRTRTFLFAFIVPLILYTAKLLSSEFRSERQLGLAGIPWVMLFAAGAGILQKRVRA